VIEVDAHGYRAEGIYCTANKIRLLGRGHGHAISFHCKGEPGPESAEPDFGDANLVWRLEGKRLWIK
jgi:hypothetical protein